jgi:cell cycle checkpoint control protein RAD9A
MREKDTAVERCDVSIMDGDGTEKSRFIVKIACRHGRTSDYVSNTLLILLLLRRS